MAALPAQGLTPRPVHAGASHRAGSIRNDPSPFAARSSRFPTSVRRRDPRCDGGRRNRPCGRCRPRASPRALARWRDGRLHLARRPLEGRRGRWRGDAAHLGARQRDAERVHARWRPHRVRVGPRRPPQPLVDGGRRQRPARDHRDRRAVRARVGRHPWRRDGRVPRHHDRGRPLPLVAAVCRARLGRHAASPARRLRWRGERVARRRGRPLRAWRLRLVAPRLPRPRQPQRLVVRPGDRRLRAAHRVRRQRRAAAIRRRGRVRLHLRSRHGVAEPPSREDRREARHRSAPHRLRRRRHPRPRGRGRREVGGDGGARRSLAPRSRRRDGEARQARVHRGRRRARRCLDRRRREGRERGGALSRWEDDGVRRRRRSLRTRDRRQGSDPPRDRRRGARARPRVERGRPDALLLERLRRGGCRRRHAASRREGSLGKRFDLRGHRRRDAQGGARAWARGAGAEEGGGRARGGRAHDGRAHGGTRGRAFRRTRGRERRREAGGEGRQEGRQEGREEG